MALIIIIVGVFLLKCYMDSAESQSNTPGDFICPKCHGKWGVERSATDLIGTSDPWHRFKCKKCGFKW